VRSRRRKPKLAVWKFASCDGCQLTLLDCEDELLTLAGELEIAHFLEVSRAAVRGPYDLSLIEGSITTPEEVDRIQQIRRQSRVLVAMGACATAGGIQALRNFADVGEFKRVVYATPGYIGTLERSLPASAYVAVDLELPGCPPSKTQVLDLIAAFLHGRRPSIPGHSLCIDCKQLGIVCVMVARGIPCLGPVTKTGCGALCPRYQRGCYGCFGPMESPNTESLGAWLTHRSGLPPERLLPLYRSFTAAAPAFQDASQRYATAELARQATEAFWSRAFAGRTSDHGTQQSPTDDQGGCAGKSGGRGCTPPQSP
jgi:coenzyme F420-reducing hydrogenase gamma subunit